MSETRQFAKNHRALLDSYWIKIRPHIAQWREAYNWKSARLDALLVWRDTMERRIKRELETTGQLSLGTFDEIMVWGFGRRSGLDAHTVECITRQAFGLLQKSGITEAAEALSSARGMGISRVSKVLALSDQYNLGIYDSRAAHGLSDLMDGGAPLIPIPPGRSPHIVCSHCTPKRLCAAYEEYIAVLQYLRDLAAEEPPLKGVFARVTDIEIALFSRSRGGLVGCNNSRSVFVSRTFER